jgi:hypothetical protein
MPKDEDAAARADTPTVGSFPRTPDFAAGILERLRSLTLRDLLVELAGVEDSIRLHRSATSTTEGVLGANHLLHLGARQRRIVYELRRRARARAREDKVMPGGWPPSSPAKRPEPLSQAAATTNRAQR